MSYLSICYSFSIGDWFSFYANGTLEHEIFNLAKEELFNHIKEKALRSKSMEVMYQFILEDIICCYSSIGRTRTNQGELDATKAHDFFTRYRMQLKLITSYNPKVNNKSEKRHLLIIWALVKAYRD